MIPDGSHKYDQVLQLIQGREFFQIARSKPKTAKSDRAFERPKIKMSRPHFEAGRRRFL